MVRIDNIGMIISLFLALIIGAILIGEIGNSMDAVAATNTANETITITSQAGQTGNDDVQTATNLFNESGALMIANVDADDGMNVTEAGVISTNNSIVTDGGTLTYTFFHSGYVKDATSRRILPITVILFAVSIIAFAVFMVMRKFRDEGFN